MEIRRSESIGELVKALALAKLKFGRIEKNRTNEDFNSRYADLSELIAATEVALSDQGLVVFQFPEAGKQSVRVSTMLAHTSDQFLANDLVIPVPTWDGQGIAAGVSYAKRIQYQAILSVTGESDDDGNSISPRQLRDVTNERTAREIPLGTLAERRAEFGLPVIAEPRINAAQAKVFWESAKNRARADVDKYFEELKINSTVEMLKKDFDAALIWAGQGWVS